ncbi:hypothetical protein T03_1467 [Trichinella britovi]|uniref:Uncharacterized protein n=1 Tax=Trichinella britovi TaxID=45882 RepID=A0A0V1C6H3_TRIBR|nr:hypothetical protein T03_1467 [Trichinella britovi]
MQLFLVSHFPVRQSKIDALLFYMKFQASLHFAALFLEIQTQNLKKGNRRYPKMLVNAECLITHIRWIFLLWFGFSRYLEATSKCYNSNGAAEADW